MPGASNLFQAPGFFLFSGANRHPDASWKPGHCRDASLCLYEYRGKVLVRRQRRLKNAWEALGKPLPALSRGSLAFSYVQQYFRGKAAGDDYPRQDFQVVYADTGDSFHAGSFDHLWKIFIEIA